MNVVACSWFRHVQAGAQFGQFLFTEFIHDGSEKLYTFGEVGEFLFRHRKLIRVPGLHIGILQLQKARFDLSSFSRGCYGLASLNGFKGLYGMFPQALSV